MTDKTKDDKNVSDNQPVIKKANEDKSKNDVKEDKYAHLRYIPVAMINAILKKLYTDNKEDFDMYFALIKMRDENKILNDNK